MYQRQLSFQEAVERALKVNYCNFSGRASRSEYWWFCLFTFLLGLVLGFFLGMFFSETVANCISSLVNLALLLPGLGLAVRRLHDTGRSGWWLLLVLTIIGSFLLLWWYTRPSQETPNEYGPVPNMEV